MEQPLRVGFSGPSGSGKGQPLYEHILTPTGWREMGQLKPGDKVINPVNGKPIPIVGVYPQGLKESYRVEFSDGTYTECDESHLWAVYRKSHGKQVLRVMGITELLPKYKTIANNGNNRFHYTIDAPVASEFGEKSLPINPYLLGYILGDGSLAAGKPFASFTVSILDWDETEARIKANLGKAEFRLGKSYENVQRFSLGGIGTELIELGLRGKKSQDKFIPPAYLLGSIQQRKELLAGLMDTDGHQSSGAKARLQSKYTTKSYQLAKDFLELVRSLGAIARLYSKDRRDRAGGTTHTVAFTLDFNPFQREYRKAIWDKNHNTKKRRNRKVKAITNIVAIGKRETQCIKVGSKDSLYITRGYTITHNTTLAKHFSEILKIPFIENSASLIISEKDREHLNINYGYEPKGHKSVIALSNANPAFGRDFQKALLTQRIETLSRMAYNGDPFIVDRTMLDNIAYYLMQCGPHATEEETEAHINLSVEGLVNIFTHLFLVKPNDGWTEDNGSRVNNNLWQQYTVYPTFRSVFQQFNNIQRAVVTEELRIWDWKWRLDRVALTLKMTPNG